MLREHIIRLLFLFVLVASPLLQADQSLTREVQNVGVVLHLVTVGRCVRTILRGCIGARCLATISARLLLHLLLKLIVALIYHIGARFTLVRIVASGCSTRRRVLHVGNIHWLPRTGRLIALVVRLLMLSKLLALHVILLLLCVAHRCRYRAS